MTEMIELAEKDVKHAQCAQTFKGKYNVTRIEIEGIKKNKMKFEIKNKIHEIKILLDRIYSNQTL